MGEEVPSNQLPLVGNPPRLLCELFILNEYNQGMTTTGPEIEATHYEIEASMINMIPSFHEIENENPYKHLDEFLDICGVVRIKNITDDALRLPFSFLFEGKDKTLVEVSNFNGSDPVLGRATMEIFEETLFNRQDQSVKESHNFVHSQ